MAKVSMVQRDLKRRKLYSKYKNKREKLLITAKDKSLSAEDRFEARLKLAQLPRNSSKNRIRNRCLITGRPRGGLVDEKALKKNNRRWKKDFLRCKSFFIIFSGSVNNYIHTPIRSDLF